MKIPNSQKAEVPESKIVDYLLSSGHPEGGPKARFFFGWGFTVENWNTLASALIKQAGENDFADDETGRHGTKYTVVAPLESPRGTTPPVKVIWIVAKGTEHPRLITAYPASQVKGMIKEHDRVVLTEAIEEYGLEPGDIGAVIYVHGEGEAFEVEFVTLDGKTAAVLELELGQVRTVGSREIPHARSLSAA